MESETEVYKGYLLLPATPKLLIKKSWQQKYCYLFKASKFGLERLEIWDSNDKKGPPVRIITLENCIKITPGNDNRFTITTKANPCPYEFCTLTTEQKHQWLSAFQSVAFPDEVSTLTIEEDNDLYCSSGEGIFNVKIHRSAASERCGLDASAQYTLVLTSTAIQLKNAYEGKVLFTWPYRYIRRYGYKNGKFTFEAGRKCDSGEGTFFVEHPNQQEIFRCISSKMKSMKKLLKDGDPPSLLDCTDPQLNVALSMEARSRSPLPPSPILPDTPTEEKKPKPVKPPRKSLAAKKSPNYEPVDKYDRIEYRSDAWRTLGVDEVKHTENVADQEEVYMSWGDLRGPVPPQTLPQAPKVIKQVTCSDNYDKLEFFGSSNKLAKSGYKQVSVASGLNLTAVQSGFNEYDEVQPAMGEIRLADDKHLGYAMVRKQGAKEREDVDHQFHNDEPYAVISKPKRV